MSKLDDKNTYKLDKSNLYQAVVSLPDQINVAWNEVKLVNHGGDGREITKIVVMGMGGSALGARIIKAWAADKLPVPLEIVNDYHLPKYVDDSTWIILSSYSGSTEEILAAGLEVPAGLKVSVICTGGPLADLAVSRGWQVYKFEPSFNPGNMPRMALGYNCMAILALINREGLVEISDAEIDEVVLWLKLQQTGLGREKNSKENAAKKLAEKLKERGVILIGARHLSGAIYAVKNQINENAKTFALFFEVPELSHHLIEGLTYPKELKKQLPVVVFESDLYEADIQKRILLTEEIFIKQGYQVIKIKPEAKTEWGQVWETIQFGEFVGFYLAMLNKLDPAPIVWVDYLKKRMSEI